MKKEESIQKTKSIKLDYPYKNFPAPPPLFNVDLPKADATQEACIQLNCGYKILKLNEFDPRPAILIYLCPQKGIVAGNSSVLASTSGKIMKNTVHSKLWFTYSALVEITSNDGMLLIDNSPKTTSDGHNATSSINISAGIFGDSPTLQAGYSSSFSTSLNDFRVKNLSELSTHKVNHQYILSATSRGKINSISDLSHFGQIGDLPDLSTTNLPIMSQALYVCKPGFKGKTTFTISVSHILLAVVEEYVVGDLAQGLGPQMRINNLTFDLPVFDWSKI